MRVKGVIILLFFFLSIYAQAEFKGNTGMNFLKIAVGIRGIGMGEANVAAADDLQSLYWNPASISQLYATEMYFMYNKWFEGINSQYFSFAVPLREKNQSNMIKNSGVVACSVNYLSVEPFQGYDTGGQPTNMVKSSDMLGTIAYGRRIYRDIFGGINFKYISETLDDVTATAYGADFGFLVKIKQHFRAGLAVQNIGTSIVFVEEAGSLPMNIKTGVAYKTIDNRMVFALDLNMPSDNDMYIGTGAEYWLKDIVALRVGYRTGIDIGNGIRAGLGFKASFFRLDYAFATFGELGDTHRIGLSMRFGQGAKLDRISTMYHRANSLYQEGRYGDAVFAFTHLIEIDPGNKQAIDMLKKTYAKIDKEEKDAKGIKEGKPKKRAIKKGKTKKTIKSKKKKKAKKTIKGKKKKRTKKTKKPKKSKK